MSNALVRGRYLAWVLSTPPESSQGPFISDRLFLADVRRRRRIDFGGIGCEAPPGDAVQSGVLIGSIALTADRRFAWICSGARSGRIEVHKLDADGPALLDRRERADQALDGIDIYSLAIAPGSAARARGRVYWSSQAGPHFADLR